MELLKEIAPRLKRAVVLRDSDNPAGIAQYGGIQTVAQSLGVELRPVDTHDAREIERAIASFARTANGGLTVTPSASVSVRHDLIVMLAARYKLPAVYATRPMIIGGGLICYGPDIADQFRQAAGYVDRILKGAHAWRRVSMSVLPVWGERRAVKAILLVARFSVTNGRAPQPPIAIHYSTKEPGTRGNRPDK